MQVAGIRRVGARVEMIEVGGPRPLASDEVLVEVKAAGVGNWDEFVRSGGWDSGARAPMALGVRAGEQVLVHGAGGVTGGLLVALAVLRGAGVIATAGTSSQQRVSALGAAHVLDYHDREWPEQVRGITGGRGVAAAASAVPSGAASPIRAVADGGRLVTITSDPPGEQRGIGVSSIYVRPDGNQLRKLAKQLGDGLLAIPVAASYGLADAARALAQVTGGHAAGAIVLTP
jgi:NADPH:quinone reductase-like Zn-dependent oxidoreductase